MFQNGVSENIFTLSMRTDELFTDREDYTETYISVANQRDEYERTNYPNGVWIIRLETKRPVPRRNLPSKGWTPSANFKSHLDEPLKLNMGRFRSSGAARKFIESRCSPEEVRPKMYNNICDCLFWQYMIDYKQCKDIVFECCRNCGNPTKEIFREPLNKLVLADFDMDEFLFGTK